MVHSSNLLFPASCGRCPETTRKKIRKAANSIAADKGISARQCHWYTVVNQRKVTPDVQRAQHVHGAHRPKVPVRRSLGMEWKPIPRMNVPIQPKICACPCAWIHAGDTELAERCALIEIRFQTPRNVPSRSMNPSPVPM